MALAPGTKVGPYEIVSSLGAGGMGEVYRAHDPRLHRAVAIKVISAEFASDPDRIRRFEQEARAAAAVTHPALLSVFDVGTHDGHPFIVSELLHGATLRDTITAPMPASRVLPLALQIAQGLAAAHAAGIVHRDLKPENVFVTTDGRAKILDFGVAKLTGDLFVPSGATMAAPAAPTGTRPGIVIGTIGYMAPEQLRGANVDGRADIFAFGAILYEMLSGKRAFEGDTSADTMSAILSKDPLDITASGQMIPDGLHRIMRHTLEKMPERRFQSARDLAFAIEAVAGATGGQASVSPATGRRRDPSLAWKIATAVLGLSVVALLVSVVLRRPAPAAVDDRVLQFSVLDANELPVDMSGLPAELVSLSPDGTMIASPRRDREGTRIWVRRLDTSSAVPLADSEGAALASPVWSPDSRELAFIVAGTLKRISVAGGPPQSIAQLQVGWGSLSWGSAGTILLGDGAAISAVPAGGGEVSRVREPAAGQVALHGASFLPDGRHYVVTVETIDRAMGGVYLGSLDGGDFRPLFTGPRATGVTFVEPGYLLYSRGRNLLARRFDPATMTADRTERLITDRLQPTITLRRTFFTASRNGIVVFTPMTDEAVRFHEYDRSGRRVRDLSDSAWYGNFSVSPDGGTIAAARLDPATGSVAIWTIDIARSVSSQLSAIDAAQNDPVWSPQGDRIAFAGIGADKAIFVIPASGGAPRKVGLISSDLSGGLDGWSPDGRAMLIHRNRTIELQPIEEGAKAVVVETIGATPDEAEFSPDGRWISYNTIGPERPQVYVVPYPPTGQRWQISNDGGVQPRWSRDGRHVYYLSPEPDAMLMEVDLPTGRPDAARSPRPLFRTGLIAAPSLDQYRVTADGFIIAQRTNNTERHPPSVIVNWPALIRQR